MVNYLHLQLLVCIDFVAFLQLQLIISVDEGSNLLNVCCNKNVISCLCSFNEPLIVVVTKASLWKISWVALYTALSLYVPLYVD